MVQTTNCPCIPRACFVCWFNQREHLLWSWLGESFAIWTWNSLLVSHVSRVHPRCKSFPRWVWNYCRWKRNETFGWTEIESGHRQSFNQKTSYSSFRWGYLCSWCRKWAWSSTCYLKHYETWKLNSYRDCSSSLHHQRCWLHLCYGLWRNCWIWHAWRSFEKGWSLQSFDGKINEQPKQYFSF